MNRQTEAGRAGEAAQAGGRMAGDERRRQIVQVAMRLFSERGFRGTTTKEIAQAAGVSEAIIFRHFATKEDLYTAIIDFKGCAGMHAGADADADAAGRADSPVFEMICGHVGGAMTASDDRAVFEGVALSMLDHHRADPDFLRLLMYVALESHSLAQVFWDRNMRVLYEFLGGYVRRRQLEGAFRDVEPNAAVRVFLGSIIHHSLINLLWDKDPARRILQLSNEEAAREFTDILLRGIAGGAHLPSQPAGSPVRAARPRESRAEPKSADPKNKKK